MAGRGDPIKYQMGWAARELVKRTQQQFLVRALGSSEAGKSFAQNRAKKAAEPDKKHEVLRCSDQQERKRITGTTLDASAKRQQGVLRPMTPPRPPA
jgi:hypothetical protein